jgi:hypothetical protein
VLANGEDLIGFLSLRLDDGFTDPVLATIDLNFVHTAGSNELAANFDESVPAINLANISALDLQIQKYALIKDAPRSPRFRMRSFFRRTPREHCRCRPI